jgi:hypothetical protein
MSVVALERVLLERVPRCVELGIKLIDARGATALDLFDDLLTRGGVLPLKLGESEEAAYVRLAGRELVAVNQDLKEMVLLRGPVVEGQFLDAVAD